MPRQRVQQLLDDVDAAAAAGGAEGADVRVALQPRIRSSLAGGAGGGLWPMAMDGYGWPWCSWCSRELVDDLVGGEIVGGSKNSGGTTTTGYTDSQQFQ